MGVWQEPWSEGELDHLYLVMTNVCGERFHGIAVLGLLLGVDLHAHTLPYCSWSTADTDAQLYILVQLWM